MNLVPPTTVGATLTVKSVVLMSRGLRFYYSDEQQKFYLAEVFNFGHWSKLPWDTDKILEEIDSRKLTKDGKPNLKWEVTIELNGKDVGLPPIICEVSEQEAKEHLMKKIAEIRANVATQTK